MKDGSKLFKISVTAHPGILEVRVVNVTATPLQVAISGIAEAAEFYSDRRQLVCQPGEPSMCYLVYLADAPTPGWITAQTTIKGSLYGLSVQKAFPAFPEGTATNPALENLLRRLPAVSWSNPGISLGAMQSWAEHEFGMVFQPYGDGILALSPLMEITLATGQFTLRPESAAIGTAFLQALADHPPALDADRDRMYFDLGVLVTTLRDYLQINWQLSEILRVIGKIVALCDRVGVPSGNLAPLYTELLRNPPLAGLPAAFQERVEASLLALEQVIAP